MTAAGVEPSRVHIPAHWATFLHPCPCPLVLFIPGSDIYADRQKKQQTGNLCFPQN
jgi:hypothetical protein